MATPSGMVSAYDVSTDRDVFRIVMYVCPPGFYIVLGDIDRGDTVMLIFRLLPPPDNVCQLCMPEGSLERRRGKNMRVGGVGAGVGAVLIEVINMKEPPTLSQLTCLFPPHNNTLPLINRLHSPHTYTRPVITT